MMRLAKLTAHGFKSFADKTVITFDKPITGIVGPNGCGKSNTVDAVKWVLGELSAKSLRGGAMMDMIFNGSSTRKPAGMASVSLTFDNPYIEETAELPVPSSELKDTEPSTETPDSPTRNSELALSSSPPPRPPRRCRASHRHPPALPRWVERISHQQAACPPSRYP